MARKSDQPKPKRRSRWSLNRLKRQPLTLPTCEGEVTLGAEHKDGKLVLLIESPLEPKRKERT